MRGLLSLLLLRVGVIGFTVHSVSQDFFRVVGSEHCSDWLYFDILHIGNLRSSLGRKVLLEFIVLAN